MFYYINDSSHVMTTKEYLLQAQSIKIQLDAMAEQLEFMKSIVSYASSPQYSDMPKSTSYNVHKNQDDIIDFIDYEEKMNKQRDKLNEINKTIYSIKDPKLQAILVKRYLSNKKWSEISLEMYMSLRHVQRLHDIALEEITKILKVGMK